MRKLHLVGFTPDREGLIFSGKKGSKSGGFVVPLEQKLLATIAEAQRARNGEEAPAGNPVAVSETSEQRSTRPESSLTPREIQARLRAGRTIAEVAGEAGVPVEWIERFAVPIIAEQANMVELARSLTYSKPRLGDSIHPLGESVMWNLRDRGVFLLDDAFDLGWSAFQLHDSVWMVRFKYQSRGRLHEVAWELDVPTERLVARDRQASELGYVEKGRRPRARAAVHDDAGDDSAATPASRRARSSRAPATGSQTGAARRSSGSAKVTRSTKAPATRRAGGGKPAGRKSTTKASAGGGRRSTPAPTEAEVAPEVATNGTQDLKGPGVRQAVAKVTAARLAATRATGPRITVAKVEPKSSARSSVTGRASAWLQESPVQSPGRPQPAAERNGDNGKPGPSDKSAEPQRQPEPTAQRSGAQPSESEPNSSPSQRTPPESQPAKPSPQKSDTPPQRRRTEIQSHTESPKNPEGVQPQVARKPTTAPRAAVRVAELEGDDDDWSDWVDVVDEAEKPSQSFAPRPLPAGESGRSKEGGSLGQRLRSADSGGSQRQSRQRRPTISGRRVGGGDEEVISPPPAPKPGIPPLKPLSERPRRRRRLSLRRES